MHFKIRACSPCALAETFPCTGQASTRAGGDAVQSQEGCSGGPFRRLATFCTLVLPTDWRGAVALCSRDDRLTPANRRLLRAVLRDDLRLLSCAQPERPRALQPARSPYAQ
jgi:hypothetical protein